jgi:hypothetical protein
MSKASFRVASQGDIFTRGADSLVGPFNLYVPRKEQP